MELIFDEGFSFSGYERDLLALNLRGGGLQDISGVSGIDSISDGRSAALADLDNDGDLDVFLTTIQGEGHLLFRNNVGQNQNFVRIALVGEASGKDAFGAVVRVGTSQGVQTQVKSGGSGFLAQHDPRLLFGLGDDPFATSVEILWPSGKLQQLGRVKAGSSLSIVEGSDTPRALSERLTRLPEPLTAEQALWSKLKIKKGDRFPKLALKSLQKDQDSKTVDLKTGVPYFLNFWATWCGPCRKEMPELQRLAPEFKAQGVEVIGLSLDRDAGPTEIREFADNLGVSYPLYLLGEESMGGVFGDEVFVPLSVVVDKEGQVIDLFAGWNAQSERRIRALLKHD